MPYRWTSDHTALQDAKTYEGSAPLIGLEIWPHRSLPTKGFVAVIWLMFAAGSIPLLSFIGTAIFWVLLVCLLITLTALWIALRRSDREHLKERMEIWPDRLQLTHWSARNHQSHWQANPYWVKLDVHPDSGPVEHYLTLRSGEPIQALQNARTVELGAFLSPEERVALKSELEDILRQLS